MEGEVGRAKEEGVGGVHLSRQRDIVVPPNSFKNQSATFIPLSDEESAEGRFVVAVSSAPSLLSSRDDCGAVVLPTTPPSVPFQSLGFIRNLFC